MVYYCSHYYSTCFIYDVMHDVVAVTCFVCIGSGAWTAFCVVLSLSLMGLFFVSVVLGCYSQQLPQVISYDITFSM